MNFAYEFASQGAALTLARSFQSLVPVLHTSDVTLRPITTGDFPVYADIVTTERGRYIGGPFNRADAWLDFIQMSSGWMLRGHGGWALASKEDNRTLGFVLLGIEPGDLEPELGFFLAAHAEGKGFAKQASVAAMTFAFSSLGWTQLVSYIAQENDRAIHLARSLGGQPDPDLMDGDTVVFRYFAGGMS
jgi:RimJ/RimL family protein N-acetyltransferase